MNRLGFLNDDNNLFLVRKSLCEQTVSIQSNVYSTYKRVLHSPFYIESGQSGIACRHTFNGIPTGAFISFHMSASYNVSSSWLYVSNGITRDYLSSSSPIVTNKTSGTSTTLHIPTTSDSNWRFTYEFRGLWQSLIY